MEYLSEGDLWQQLQKVDVFSQKRTQFYTAEIMLALQYIHKKGIIHR
jgi:serine/threonine protein kinase